MGVSTSRPKSLLPHLVRKELRAWRVSEQTNVFRLATTSHSNQNHLALSLRTSSFLPRPLPTDLAGLSLVLTLNSIHLTLVIRYYSLAAE